jgi:hypothetical protein
MKTSAVLSSLLFGSFAVAAPFDRRALAYKTEIVTETVVVYTTVWEDEPVAQATTTPAGYFYEQPKAPSSAVAEVTPTPKAPAAEKPTVAPVAPVAPKTTPSPSPVPSPTPAPYSPPAPVVEQSKPVAEAAPTTTTEAAKPTYEAPAPQPTTTTAAAAPAYTAPAYTAPAASPSAPASGYPSTGGATYQNVDMTIYDNNGGFGACGTELHDTDMIVALAAPTWGKSTYDVMTGAATNPWCGQKIKIDYNGNSIEATIMDLCPGCAGQDIDLSLAAWTKLTGLQEKTRLKASWSKMD